MHAGSDLDGCLAWLIESLRLTRQRPMTSGGTADEPVHRILRTMIVGGPRGWDAKELADVLGSTPQAVHHHLRRLVETGLIRALDDRSGWRQHFLRGGTISTAIERLTEESRTVLSSRLAELGRHWIREDEVDPRASLDADPPPLHVHVTEWCPPRTADASALTMWMDGLGMLGERSSSALNRGSDHERILLLLLARTDSASAGSIASDLDITTSKATRVLERFRASGLVERVPQHGILGLMIWQRMRAQLDRRGPAWIRGRGGLDRFLSNADAEAILEGLTSGDLDPDDFEQRLSVMSIEDQAVLLNLLGGRLPMGYRMVAGTARGCARVVLDRFDPVLRRLERVGRMIEDNTAPDAVDGDR